MRKLVIGCGYLGLRVARLWRDAGHEVAAVTRSPVRAKDFEQEGLAPIVADVTAPDTLVGLPAADTVLFAVGFDRSAGKPINEVYVDGLRNVLAALPAPQRFLYISSTGVYGSADGDWVDEETPCHPDREGGRACLAAEETLRRHPLAARVVVLRMAGIYGPGRIPRAGELTAGRAVPANPDSFLNLVHVDDAAAVVLRAEDHAQPPRTYVVSDGHPALRREYFATLAELLGAPTPTFAPPASEAVRGTSDKRVRSSRLMAELAPQLKYPSYREGLTAILRGDSSVSHVG